MPAIHSLIVQSKYGDNKIQKAIPNVNPDASMAQIDSFAKKFTAMSVASYVDTIRVTKESVNEALAAE